MIDYAVRVTLAPDNTILALDSNGGVHPEGGVVGQCKSSFVPVEHLLIALGSCLIHFARRYLTRRGWRSCPIAELRCRVDEHACEIADIHVHLSTTCSLGTEQRAAFQRTLELCPIHKALAGAVPICISVSTARQHPAEAENSTL